MVRISTGQNPPIFEDTLTPLFTIKVSAGVYIKTMFCGWMTYWEPFETTVKNYLFIFFFFLCCFCRSVFVATAVLGRNSAFFGGISRPNSLSLSVHNVGVLRE